MVALASFYFTYFVFIGGFNPYFGLWMTASGYSAADVGYALAVAAVMRSFTPLFWGRLADKQQRHARVLRIMAVGSLAGLGLIYAAPSWLWLMCALVVFHAMLAGQVPLTDVLLFKALGDRPDRYGQYRLYGSLGFIVAVALAGSILDWVGINHLLPLVSVVLLCHIIVAWRLPQGAAAAHTSAATKPSFRALLRLPSMRWLLLSNSLMVVAHSSLYAYLSLFLEQAGYSKTVIGALWAWSAAVELLYFWAQSRLKLNTERAYLFCYGVAVLRFAAMALLAVPYASSLTLLVVLQALHCITFAVHHSQSLLLTQQIAPPHSQGAAQTLNYTVSYGAGSALGALIAAQAWQHDGAQLMFLISAGFAAAGGIAAWVLLRKHLLLPKA